MGEKYETFGVNGVYGIIIMNPLRHAVWVIRPDYSQEQADKIAFLLNKKDERPERDKDYVPQPEKQPKYDQYHDLD